MAFTEFCARSGGSNLNAGTRTGNSTEPGTAADFTYASGTWVASTRTFTPVSGNPSTDGVAAGDFGSVYIDASTVTGYVARVTSVTATTIVFSATALAGAAPADGVATRTCKIGGAWKGPNAAVAFPYGFITTALTDSSINRPRINLKNDATYSITAAMTHALSGPIRLQGYTTAYGDLGRATIDGGTSGASYILLLVNNVTGIQHVDIKFQNNGATGSADGVQSGNGAGAGTALSFLRCVFSNFRGSGLLAYNGVGVLQAIVECEAFACNASNTASKAGFYGYSTDRFIRCVSHDNVGGGNCHGFFGNGLVLIHCIADSNAGDGARTESAPWHVINSDFYNNTGSGFIVAGAGSAFHLIENSNFIKNGAYGINLVATETTSALIINCGFGAGTQANTSGATNITTGTDNVEVIGSVTYAADVTPWVDPANGDFRINLAAAKGTGRETFTQTAASYAGTVGYPDIGAAQHLESGGAAGMIRHPGMAGGLNA